jgi:tRNA-specific 2-thiouridylase
MRGLDRSKDQTYFLWGLPRETLSRLHFPVGELTKPAVRAYARRLGLVTADKPESQEICFVPTGDYADFLGRRLGESHPALSAGALVTRQGDVVGEHRGYARYTVGQRRGLGGGRGEPLFVLGVRPERNEVVVGASDELISHDVGLSDLNWIADPPVRGENVLVQVRHRAPAVSATVQTIDDASARLILDEGQRAITPGQSGVVYRGEELVGGGRISG